MAIRSTRVPKCVAVAVHVAIAYRIGVTEVTVRPILLVPDPRPPLLALRWVNLVQIAQGIAQPGNIRGTQEIDVPGSPHAIPASVLLLNV
jgi:hypothetical protein